MGAHATEQPPPQSPYRRQRAVAGVIIFLVVVGASLTLWRTGLPNQLLVPESLKQTALQLGLAGPVLIVGLMIVAIVMIPIPSAPIALASGAAYGHLWGSVYVLLGCLGGATIAFSITRLVGQDRLMKRLDTNAFGRLVASQNAMMYAVFVSRLLPFMSFDVVSYAAGLTAISTGRFALATFLGLLPSSFLLAHFGAELGAGDMWRASMTLLALSLFALLPFTWRFLPKRWQAAVERSIYLSQADKPPR